MKPKLNSLATGVWTALGVTAVLSGALEVVRQICVNEDMITRYGYVSGEYGSMVGVIFSDEKISNSPDLLSDGRTQIHPEIAVTFADLKSDEYNSCGLLLALGYEEAMFGYGCFRIPDVGPIDPGRLDEPTVPRVPNGPLTPEFQGSRREILG